MGLPGGCEEITAAFLRAVRVTLAVLEEGSSTCHREFI